jgi:hypothetical protein
MEYTKILMSQNKTPHSNKAQRKSLTNNKGRNTHNKHNTKKIKAVLVTDRGGQ